MNGNKPNIIFTGTCLADVYGGGLTVIINMLEKVNKYNYTLIAKHDTLGKFFTKNNHKYIRSRSAFEPVTKENILLSPLSFIMGFSHFLRYYKQFKNAKRVIEIGHMTDIVFVFPYLILFLGIKPIILLQIKITKAVEKNPFRFIIQWVFNNSELVFVSYAQRQTFLEAGFILKNSEVIYYGLEKDLFKINKASTNKLKLGFIGRIHKEKGIFELSEALKELNIEYELFVGGGGQYEKEFKESLNKNGINYTWLGWIENKLEFFNQIDLLIVPSRSDSGESFGQVLTESWQLGTPALTSDIGCFKELKEFAPDLEKQLIFKADSAFDLKNKIIEFSNTKEKYLNSNYSNELQIVIQENFGVDKTLSKYLDLIEKTN